MRERRQFRWIWRVDPTQRLLRVCVWEGYSDPFKLSLALQLRLFRWEPQWDGWFVTVLGVRVHYRESVATTRRRAGLPPLKRATPPGGGEAQEPDVQFAAWLDAAPSPAPQAPAAGATPMRGLPQADDVATLLDGARRDLDGASEKLIAVGRRYTDEHRLVISARFSVSMALTALRAGGALRERDAAR